MSAGPFAQVSLAPHPRVTLTAGVRYDYYRFRATDRKLDDGDQSGERTMGAASPSVGVTVAATSNLNLYGNFATAYETPTTVELSNTPDGTGGFNQLLDPERLRSAEVGIRGLIEPARLQYDIAYYRGPRPRRPRALPARRRADLLRQRGGVGAQRRRALARLAAGLAGPGAARLHAAGLHVRGLRARRHRLQRQPGAGRAAQPHVRGVRLRGPVRPAVEPDGPLGGRVPTHQRQRRRGQQLGLHGGRPALRLGREPGRRRRPAVPRHRQPALGALQLVGHHQRVRPPLLRAVAGAGDLRRHHAGRGACGRSGDGLVARPHGEQSGEDASSRRAAGAATGSLRGPAAGATMPV